jgi:Uma2 family endonuclease
MVFMTTAPDLFARASRGPVCVSDLPEDTEGALYELIDGSLYVTPSADAPHQMLCFDLGLVLAPRLPAGLRVAPGVNVVVGEQTLVIPDVAVIDPGHLTHRDLGVAPSGLALVIEVTSMSTRRRDLSIKRELYQEWKVPYVVVDRSGGPYTVSAYGPPLPEWITLDALRIG